MIEDEYKIIYIGSKRYYKIDLSFRALDFEHTSPYSLSVRNYEIKESGWNNMILRLAQFLNECNPKDRNELLLIRNDWGKQQVFSEIKKSNFKEFDYNLYVNVNHTAVHAVWTIQLLLSEWGINPLNCELIIHRQPKSEKEEVIKYFTYKTIKGFKDFMRFTTSYSLDTIEKLVVILQKINSIMCPIVFPRSGYNNIFVLDEYLHFDKMKTDLFHYIQKKYLDKPTSQKNCLLALTNLGKYYKTALRT